MPVKVELHDPAGSLRERPPTTCGNALRLVREAGRVDVAHTADHHQLDAAAGRLAGRPNCP